MTNKRQKAYRQGVWAELFAALYLTGRGYRILKRRYKTKGGEIDLIAKKGKSLLFVEVKARSDIDTALESINVRTKKRIEKAGLHFLSRHPHYNNYEMRFDVIAIAKPFRLRHLDNAWQPRS